MSQVDQILNYSFEVTGFKYQVKEFLTLGGWQKFYDEVATDFKWDESFWLNSVEALFGSLIIYLVFVYGVNFILGERKRGEKEPQNLWTSILKWLAVVHNLNMTLISLVCFCGTMYEVARIFWASQPGYGLFNLVCDPKIEYNHGKHTFWMYVYYLSKYVEYFDTVFIVLRRSELRFIHTYHHVITMMITYYSLFCEATGPWLIISLNTFVHIVMYYYYMLVTLDVKDIPWKNSLTDIQLTQFVLDITMLCVYIYWDLVSERPVGSHCNGNIVGAMLGVIIIGSFFIMFFRLRQANAKRMRLANEKKQQEKKLKAQ